MIWARVDHPLPPSSNKSMTGIKKQYHLFFLHFSSDLTLRPQFAFRSGAEVCFVGVDDPGICKCCVSGFFFPVRGTGEG